MRRYLFSGNIEDCERVDIDVLIAGNGAAGLYSALNLDDRLNCILLNKAGDRINNSMYAQGGIAAVLDNNNIGDDPDKHYNDTLIAGAGLCDENAVRILVDEAQEDIGQLLHYSVPFDMLSGKLLLTREGGHTMNRILHCGGDATGLNITESLLKAVMNKKNLSVRSGVFLTDIITDVNGAVTGAIAIDSDDNYIYFATGSIIIATGGIGRVYKNSTNAVSATGDGIAAAQRAGAYIKDMEFVQFHPTALVHPDDTGRFFLISEALRGEGAILRNRLSEPFMKGVHPMADLAPRDIVSRAIITEMRRSNIPYVYLDITHKSREFLKNRFPTIYNECMHRGLDIATEWIPVLPVQHYLMGGIHTDIDGHTSVPGLYACGECACTGIHGANRLASNSLLECLVFGRRSAKSINSDHFSNNRRKKAGSPVFQSRKTVPATEDKILCVDFVIADDFTVDFDAIANEVRSIMTKKSSIIKKRTEMEDAMHRIKCMADYLDNIKLDTAHKSEVFNQVHTAIEVLRAGLERKNSVGAHFVLDE